MNCTNPDCSRALRYAQGDFEVICSACGTRNFVTQNAFGSDSRQDNFDPEDFYIPEESQLSISHGGNMLPDELAQEETNIKKDSKDERSEIAKLVDHKGTSYHLVEGKNIIGRKEAHVVIDDLTVSRKHCIVEVSLSTKGAYEYHIYDIGFEEGSASTNGVFVSGRTQRLQDYEKLPLSPGSTFRIGETSLKLS